MLDFRRWIFIMAIELEKKKDSNDYPLVAFRVSQEEKDEIMEGLEELVNIINKNKDEDEKLARKNKVFVEAIKRGIVDLKKDYPRKKK